MTELEPALGPDTRGAPSEPASRRASWPVVALCGLIVAAAAWGVAGSHWLEPNLSTNLDEQAYLHQADLLAHGRLSVSVPSDRLARNFQPWFAAPTDHGYIFKYNLVWPAVLTATTLVSAPRLALAFAIALFLVGTYALAVVLLRSRAKAVAAAAVVALSPLALIQSTTVLSYVLFGGLWTLAAAALVHGVTRRADRRLAAAGALGALAFCARPFDALLVLLPFAAWAVWALRRDGAALARAAGWTFGAAAPVLALQAVYNTYVTGVPWKLPYSLWSTSDRLGFGDRGLLASGVPQVHFGPRQGLHAVAVNLWSLHTWAFGGVVLVFLALCGVAALRHRPESFPLVAVAVVVPVGYVFFWGIANISLLSKAIDRFGPYYFVPLLVPLAIFGVEGAVSVWSWRRWVLVALGAVAIVTTAIGTGDAVSFSLAERDARAQPYDALSTVTGHARPALVLLPGEFVGTSVIDRSSVDTDRSTRTLYAVGSGNVDLELLAHYLGHTPYRLAACTYSAQAPLGSHQFPDDVTPSEALVTGRGARARRLHITTRPASGLTLHALVDPGAVGDGTLDVAAGTHRASAPLRPSSPGGAAAVTVRIAPSGLSLTGDIGDVTTTTGPDAPLSIRALTRDSPTGPVRSRSWSAPVRLGSDGVTTLVPAQTFASPDYPSTPDAETCRADPALHVTIDAPERVARTLGWRDAPGRAARASDQLRGRVETERGDQADRGCREHDPQADPDLRADRRPGVELHHLVMDVEEPDRDHGGDDDRHAHRDPAHDAVPRAEQRRDRERSRGEHEAPRGAELVAGPVVRDVVDPVGDPREVCTDGHGRSGEHHQSGSPIVGRRRQLVLLGMRRELRARLRRVVRLLLLPEAAEEPHHRSDDAPSSLRWGACRRGRHLGHVRAVPRGPRGAVVGARVGPHRSDQSDRSDRRRSERRGRDRSNRRA